jgi:hypothetical protein
MDCASCYGGLLPNPITEFSAATFRVKHLECLVGSTPCVHLVCHRELQQECSIKVHVCTTPRYLGRYSSSKLAVLLAFVPGRPAPVASTLNNCTVPVKIQALELQLSSFKFSTGQFNALQCCVSGVSHSAGKQLNLNLVELGSG